jgi:hypothetical protein
VTVLHAQPSERQGIDVDHDTRPRQPVGEERHQALTARQRLGVGAVLAKQGYRLGRRRRRRVFKWMHAKTILDAASTLSPTSPKNDGRGEAPLRG